MSVSRQELQESLNALLQPQDFSDYCPNGLQLEGKDSIQRLVTGVTASQALLDAAVAAGADAVLVHHGWFWRGEAEPIVGMKKRRIETALAAGLNVFAYHLPLDAHPELGNNVQLAKQLKLSEPCPCPGEPLLWEADLGGQPLRQLAETVESALGRKPLVEVVSEKPIRKLVFCTGGAQGYIEQAAALGADAYLSGEVSEPTIHVARELGLHYIAAGHHATERYGVQAVGAYLADEFGIEHRFIDIDNPA